MFWMLKFGMVLMQVEFIEQLLSLIWAVIRRVLLFLPRLLTNAVEMVRLIW
ncbi:MAG: hypothetical protein SVE93_00545 [Candidatus Thermoplasmatota archaeon]|nr:hypothetical protein [Candidatus Thermoplasmatota archaeon]